MKIISHRGYWLQPNEKNTIEAFRRSFSLGYGTETDIRDYSGKLVISHDMPKGNEITFEEMITVYKSSGCDSFLALNIKSDGLQKPIKRILEEYSINNYFLFDMSVPDAVVSINEGLKCFTRQSEYEQNCSFYDLASGVWIDEFLGDWVKIEDILEHINNEKKVCIVSPDLHNRDPVKKWNELNELSKKYDLSEVILCTDYPEKAEGVINGND